MALLSFVTMNISRNFIMLKHSIENNLNPIYQALIGNIWHYNK